MGEHPELKVLFCADPLTPARVDEHFAGQAQAVRELGGQVALIDHDALLRGETGAAVRRVPRDSGPWWYRGWMMPADTYADFARALGDRDVTLRVPPRRYRLAHELPSWYPTFHSVTPESLWQPWNPGQVPDEDFLSWMTETFGEGPAVVKDYVKSRKHEWHEACYIPEVADLAHATAVMARMVELQEENLNGGIVLRRFEEYRQEGGRTVEARVWWVDGQPALITAHPDTPGRTAQPDLTAIAPLVVGLGCPFVTTDVAERADGVWRVVEVGDGQVSDMPAEPGLEPLLALLAQPTTIDAPPPCPRCGKPGVAILYGLPTPRAREAGHRGELELYGCISPLDPPHWRCPKSHEWSTTDAQHVSYVSFVLADNPDY